MWWGLLGKDTQRDGLDLQIVQMVRACGACEGRNTLVGRVRSWRTLDAMLFGSYLYGHCGEGEVDSDFRISTLAALRKATRRRRTKALDAETSTEAPTWEKGWNKVKKGFLGLL